MKFRWTIKELNPILHQPESSRDHKSQSLLLIRAVLDERMSDLNPYASLYKALSHVKKEINEKYHKSLSSN